MSKYAGLVQNELRDLRGNAMTNAVVRVYNAGTGVLATLYDNPVEIAAATGADTLVNDAVTGIPASASLLQPGLDEAANYTFYADSDAEYDINVAWNGEVFEYRVRPNLHAPSGAFIQPGDLVRSIADAPYNAVEGGVEDCLSAILAAMDDGPAYVPEGTWRIGGSADPLIPLLSDRKSLTLHPLAILVVDEGYAGTVFRIAPTGLVSTRWAEVRGGQVTEAGTPQQLWTGLAIDGDTKGVYFSGAREIHFDRPGTAVLLRTGEAAAAFVTYCDLIDITAWHPRVLVDWQTDKAVPNGLDGLAANNLCRVRAQAGAGITTHGFRNIRGRRTRLDECSIIDLNQNPTAVSGNVVAGALETLITGGAVREQNWEDLGSKTQALDSSGAAGTTATVQRVRTLASQGIADATVVDITGLTADLEDNSTYEFELEVIYDTTSVNDMRLGVLFPSGATIAWYGQGPASSAVTPVANGNWEVITTGGLSTFGGVRATGAAARRAAVLMRGRVVTAGTAGTLQVRGAKNINTDAASPADDFTVYAGSGGTVTKIEVV